LVSDSHDFWNLQILNDDGTVSTDKTLTWRPLTQQFQLQHIRGCMLVSHNAWYMPPLGDGHQEVTCMAQAGEHIMKWQVESSHHEQCKQKKRALYYCFTQLFCSARYGNGFF
jgi:dolichyl-phosphate-mannose--protein O-mannosyl transferase